MSAGRAPALAHRHTRPILLRAAIARRGRQSCNDDVLSQVREFLEKHYEEAAGNAAVKLAIRALMETVEASSKSIEIAVMERDTGAPPAAPPGLGAASQPCSCAEPCCLAVASSKSVELAFVGANTAYISRFLALPTPHTLPGLG